MRAAAVQGPINSSRATSGRSAKSLPSGRAGIDPEPRPMGGNRM